ncbi:nucleotidyltransferase family protein [Candidatus Pacearchaeota archaeon]|nr:nucleotidyltransferase family protein [Candidatus Pacearchaeota archaeon]
MKNISKIEEIKEKIMPILKDYKVIKAGIFGSFARGKQNNKSDVDILVEIDGGTDLIDLIRLKRDIEESLKKKVDLVEYAGIRKELRKNILNNEIPIIQ